MGYDNLKATDFLQFKSYNSLYPSGQTGFGTTVRYVTSKHADLWGYILHNNDAATRWIQVWFLNSGVVLGTTPPDLTIMLGASQSIAMEFDNPIRKIGGTGLALAGTTTETGSSAPTAEITGTIFYKELA